MASLNRVTLIGNLGADPELKYTPSGIAVCNLRIATTEKWKDKTSGQLQEKTEWHRATVWREQAENCGKYLAKGRQVFIEGRLETRSWEQDGTKRYSTEITATNVVFLGSGNGERAQGGGGGGRRGDTGSSVEQPPSGDMPPPSDDEIPFIRWE